MGTLVLNVTLVALYASQVYAPHSECIIEDKNITFQYELAFRLGLIAFVGEFMLLMLIHIQPCNKSERDE